MLLNIYDVEEKAICHCFHNSGCIYRFSFWNWYISPRICRKNTRGIISFDIWMLCVMLGSLIIPDYFLLSHKKYRYHIFLLQRSRKWGIITCDTWILCIMLGILLYFKTVSYHCIKVFLLQKVSRILKRLFSKATGNM